MSDIFETIQKKLEAAGIDLEALCDAEGQLNRVVCMVGGVSDSLEEMGKEPRDQVVMVRVDADTVRKLDQWVETEAVSSRSEAAALFIREGLKVRSRELDELAEALKGVEDARRNLKEKARDVFGD